MIHESPGENGAPIGPPERYDRRIHGKPLKHGDTVWLHCPTVPRGHARKLHHPWKGPFNVLDQITEVDYRIRSTRGQSKTLVVHFNRLKPYSENTRPNISNTTREPTSRATINTSPPGTNLKLIWDDSPQTDPRTQGGPNPAP